ncbi:MAG: hypothetical protein GY810_26725 [Aureispira sp.]|nr:hypothetical protein [Aureispira sp.]
MDSIGYIIIITVIISMFLVWPLLKKATHRSAKKTLDKLSDSDLLQLIYSLKNPINSKKVAANSTLTIAEARNRLQLLMLCGAVYANQDGAGNVRDYSQKGLAPNIKAPLNSEELSSPEIGKKLVQYIKSGDVHAGQIAILLNLPILEAEQLLKKLAKDGVVKTSYGKGFRKIYTLTALNYTENNHPIEQEQVLLDTVSLDERIKILDADIIDLAAQHDGRITPLLLCTTKRIPLAEAKIALDELYDHGAFFIDADYENGTLEYWLRDKSIIKKKK